MCHRLKISLINVPTHKLMFHLVFMCGTWQRHMRLELRKSPIKPFISYYTETANKWRCSKTHTWPQFLTAQNVLLCIVVAHMLPFFPLSTRSLNCEHNWRCVITFLIWKQEIIIYSHIFITWEKFPSNSFKYIINNLWWILGGGYSETFFKRAQAFGNRSCVY